MAAGAKDQGSTEKPYSDSFYTYLLFYGQLLPYMVSAETHGGLVPLFPTIYKALLEHTYLDAIYKSLGWLESNKMQSIYGELNTVSLNKVYL